MSSRSATVLVIFIVAIIAFCLASVFGAMTGEVNIFPNETDTGSVLDNLSAITDNDSSVSSYGSGFQSNDYQSSDDSQSSDNVDDDSKSTSQQKNTVTESKKVVEKTETQTESVDSVISDDSSNDIDDDSE